MEVFGKTKFCLDLQINFLLECWFINQHILRKTLKHLNMDKTYPLSSLMVVQPTNMKNDSFRHHEKDKILLDLEAPYLSAISVLMYLANCTV